MAYQTVPATSSGSVSSGIPVASFTISSPRLVGLRTGGPSAPVELSATETTTTEYPRGALLGDANVTVQPFVDQCTYYVMPAGTMTANREITLGNTGITTSFISGSFAFALRIVRLDKTAFTLTVRRSDAVVILVDIASPPIERELQFICAAGGIWAASAFTCISS